MNPILAISLNCEVMIHVYPAYIKCGIVNEIQKNATDDNKRRVVGYQIVHDSLAIHCEEVNVELVDILVAAFLACLI